MVIPRGRGVSKAQFFERKYDTKMEFPEGGGFNLKNLPWEGYGYFLEWHITSPIGMQWVIILSSSSFTRYCLWYRQQRMNASKVCMEFKLIHALDSLFFSSRSVKFWNSFWTEIINNKIILTLISLANRPPNFPKSQIYLPQAIGHFWAPLCLCFKASLSAKPSFWKWLWFAWRWHGM